MTENNSEDYRKERSRRWYLKNREKILAQKKQYHQENRERINQEKKEYRRKNHDTIREKRKEYYQDNKTNVKARHLNKLYGITWEEYKRLWIAQEGSCAICGIYQLDIKNQRALYVDHDHTTGKIRGLLCNHCNVGIGHFEENIHLLEKAKDYLRLHGK